MCFKHCVFCVAQKSLSGTNGGCFQNRNIDVAIHLGLVFFFSLSSFHSTLSLCLLKFLLYFHLFLILNISLYSAFAYAVLKNVLPQIERKPILLSYSYLIVIYCTFYEKQTKKKFIFIFFRFLVKWFFFFCV